MSPVSAKNSLLDQAKQCSRFIKNARFLTVLTGAGISTAAGIPDFRGPQGLYRTQKYDPDIIFNIEYFINDPEPFFNFARDLLQRVTKIKPTFAHKFLAELEQKNILKGIITQNIDGLHHLAGSKNILELHGSFATSHCLNCRRWYSFEELKQKIIEEKVPKCFCGGVIKPDVVFFGENILFYQESYQLALRSDLMLVIGSSCIVQPAAMIPRCINGKVIIINEQNITFDPSKTYLLVQDDIDHFLSLVDEEIKQLYKQE